MTLSQVFMKRGSRANPLLRFFEVTKDSDGQNFFGHELAVALELTEDAKVQIGLTDKSQTGICRILSLFIIDLHQTTDI